MTNDSRIKELKRIKIALRGSSIGALAFVCASLSNINKTPFKQDMIKSYVPSIKTINEEYSESASVLEPKKQSVYGKKGVSLLVQYNTSWEKKNNGLYEQKQMVYAYQNIKEEDILDIVNNPQLLDEYLEKRSEYSFYAKDVSLENNYPKYNIEVIDEDKSVYQYYLESKKDALIDTSIFLSFAAVVLFGLKKVNDCIDERVKELEEKDIIARRLTK